MATAPDAGPLRKLRELLEEQQEPFLPALYLLETDLSGRSFILGGGKSCWPIACKDIKGLVLLGERKRKVVLHCSTLLKLAIRKLSHGERRSRGKCGSDCTSLSLEPDGFTSASSKTLCDSCSDGNSEESPSSTISRLRCLKLCQLRKQEREFLEGRAQDTKQLSPVSVLEGPSDEASGEEQAKLSAYHRLEYLAQRITAKLSTEVSESPVLHGFPSSTQTTKSRRQLKQSRQLLQDCAREAVKNYVKSRRRKENPTMVPAETLEKIVRHQIRSWRSQKIGATKAREAAKRDFCNTVHDWLQLEPQIKEIGTEIGDDILREMLDGVVLEVL